MMTSRQTAILARYADRKPGYAGGVRDETTARQIGKDLWAERAVVPRPGDLAAGSTGGKAQR
jgi:hypothetical protein